MVQNMEKLEQGHRNKNRAFWTVILTDSYFKEHCRLWCFESALREAVERTSLTEVETWAAKAFF